MSFMRASWDVEFDVYGIGVVNTNFTNLTNKAGFLCKVAFDYLEVFLKTGSQHSSL